ncbi:MAG: PAS domain-containing protein [Anaerolineales bacterium]|nr:PAS domain-containing protein [Anaerolineales bacterium]
MADQQPFDNNNMQDRVNKMFAGQDFPTPASIKEMEAMKARIKMLETQLAQQELAARRTAEERNPDNVSGYVRVVEPTLSLISKSSLSSRFAWLAKIWDWLTKPSADLTEVGERNSARLAASFLIIIFLLEFTGGLARIPRLGLVDAFFGPIAYALIPTLAAYFLARSRWYLAAIFVFSLAFASLAYVSMVMGGNQADISALILVYVPLSLIVASTFLSSWAVFLLTGLNIGAFFLTTRFGIAYTPDNFGAQAGIITTMGFVLIALSIFRNNNEQLRLNSLKLINKQLDDAKSNLEKRVADRTHDLELASEVGKAIAARVDNLYQLLSEAVELVRARFNLYYTQVYLTDQTGRSILLRAGTGDVGKQLLQRGHQLPVNTASLNGQAALEKHPIIVADTLNSSTFLPNPLLPKTRSEMSVPLMVGNRVVGVLDVQSEYPNAFNESNLPAFEALAGQLAVAVQNASLFEDVNQARSELEEQAKRQSHADWVNFLNAVERSEKMGYIFNQIEVIPYVNLQEDVSELNSLHAPIQVAGVEIGKIHIVDNPERKWTGAEADIIHNTATQLSRHIENLRLLAQSEKYRFEAEQASKRLTREGWEGYLKASENPSAGYVYNQYEVTSITDALENGHASQIKQPLLIREEVVGELEAEHPVNMTREESEALIRQVADSLSAHIENLRLTEQTQAALLSTEKLYNASRTLTAAQTEQEALNELVQRLDRTGLDRIVAALKISNEPMTAEVVAAWDRDGLEARSIGNRFTDAQLPLVAEIRPGIPVIFEDFDAPHVNPLTQKVFKMQGVRSAAIVPISSNDEILGWLLLETTHTTRQFQQAFIQQYLAFSEQVATVIQKQRLFERAEVQRLEIQQNEARLSEALKIARLGNWEYNFEKDIFTFNDNFYAVFRTNVQEVGSYEMSSAEYTERFVYPEDAPLVGHEIGKALASTERHFNAHVEHRAIFPDGSIGYISVNINLERDEDGKIIRWQGANQDITEQKLAEEAIRINESRLSEALRIARLGNWEYDVEKDIFTFNDQFYSIFHTSAEKVGGYRLSSAQYAELFVHPDDMPIVGEEIGKALNSTERVYTASLEHRILYAGGEIGYIAVNLTVERDENGKITRYYGANQDITERKLAEEAIRKAQEQYELAIQGANDGIWDWDIANDNIYYSARWKSMLGYEEHELTRGFQDWEDLIHPDDHERAVKALEDYLEQRAPEYDIELRLRHKDGTWRWIRDRGKALRREDGTPYRMAGSHSDINESKEAENLIAQRANQLETVATVSTTTSTVLNPDELLQTVVDLTKERFGLYHTHIYLADDAWNTLLLAAGSGEVGRSMVATGHAIQTNTVQSLVARAYRERNAIIVNDIREDEGFLPNPLLPETRAEMAVPMIVGDNVIGVFDLQSEEAGSFTGEDALIYNTLASQVAIALQNARLYQEQAAAVTQLRELDRLKSSFLANMSHELRTPLNSILGFADVMLEGLDGPLTDYMNNDLRLIQKNGQHLLHLINDVLDMAKIESGRMNLHPELFSVHEIMEEVTSITSTLASDKNLALYIEPDSDREVQINADRTRLRQVMINLVNNALKFTEKGHVAIHVTKTDEENILICVRDTGLGIPPEQLDDIFNEFTQVDTSTTRKAGGTGLGLPISRRLVEMHGGELWAKSTGIEGEGSTFYVKLPVEAHIIEVEKQEKK